ncbi:MAG: glycoside hydrolase family 88 protein [Clostridia bacterium]|nr:glycoside hydrolase family 88 protein [Clostridia bacterium]
MITKKEIAENLKSIAENMLVTRPKKDVKLRPFIKHGAIKKSPRKGRICAEVEVDLNGFYPQAKNGDYAFVTTELSVPFENDVAVVTSGCSEIFFRGEKVEQDSDGKIVVRCLEGKNELCMKCVKQEENFSLTFVPSILQYPGMWATDYLYHIKALIPVEEYNSEEGVAVSKLNSKETAFPEPTKKTEKIDFFKLFENQNGDYAFALTYCSRDTFWHGEGDLFVNGKWAESSFLKKGDEVVVRFIKGNKWGFSYNINAGFNIPFLETTRNNGTNWLLLGPFETPEVPKVQFKKPYGNKFWRLADGSYVRPYLDSYFYGKWFYALMVGEYGILKASEILGESYYDYFVDSMTVISDYYEYMQYEYKEFGCPTFLERSVNLDNLDAIGAIGMNLCELYKINKSDDTKKILYNLADAALNNIPRFPDGTYHRAITMWADDLFMSCPFLARMGAITGEAKYFDECARQILGFKNYLFMDSKKIFSHIYFMNDEQMSRVPWGRGNGWIFFAISEVLQLMDKKHAKYNEIVSLFAEFAEGILSYQEEDGMWHQVLDYPESYKETSCTAMFALGMIRGIRNGWLDEKFYEAIVKAINGIFTTALDKNFNISGVCMGSECSYDPKYYAQLGAALNDDHGTGVVLTMLTEFIKYEESKNSKGVAQ